ncbi:MAG: hypothetical protein IKN64_11105 [Desulfovibrio sp.]|nr:hypothetical protein [Desulfovibrio sp.]
MDILPVPYGWGSPARQPDASLELSPAKRGIRYLINEAHRSKSSSSLLLAVRAAQASTLSQERQKGKKNPDVRHIFFSPAFRPKFFDAQNI